MINQCSVCGINDAKVEKIKMVVFTAALAAQKLLSFFITRNTRSLPHKQLRNQHGVPDSALNRSLPHRQL